MFEVQLLVFKMDANDVKIMDTDKLALARNQNEMFINPPKSFLFQVLKHIFIHSLINRPMVFIKNLELQLAQSLFSTSKD